MKIISLDEMLSRLLPITGDVFVSVSDYEFLAGWEPEIFRELCGNNPIKTFSFVADESTGEIGKNGYFRLFEGISDAVVESIARFMSVRMFVKRPRQNFFEEVPPLVRNAVFHRGMELDKAVLSVAASLSNFDWMALRDGDEGDAYYYLFE